MTLLWLFACAPEAAESWAGSWEVAAYRAAVVPFDEPTTDETEPVPVGAPTTTGASTAASCESEPVFLPFADVGFDITVDEMVDSWYVQVHPCSGPNVCDAVPWAAGGSLDLGTDGGTARVAGVRFLANSAGGGLCELDWWELALAGTPEAPSLTLKTERYDVALSEGDAATCEAQLEEVTTRDCTGMYLLDGEAW